MTFFQAYPTLASKHGAKLQWLDKQKYYGTEELLYCRLLCCLLESGVEPKTPVQFHVRTESLAYETTTNPWMSLVKRIARVADRAFAAWVLAPADHKRHLEPMQQILGVLHFVAENGMETDELARTRLRLRAAGLLLFVAKRPPEVYDLCPSWMAMCREVLSTQEDAPDLPWDAMTLVCQGDRRRYHGEWVTAAQLYRKAVKECGWEPTEDRAQFLSEYKLYTSVNKAPAEEAYTTLKQSTVFLKGHSPLLEYSFSL